MDYILVAVFSYIIGSIPSGLTLLAHRSARTWEPQYWRDECMENTWERSRDCCVHCGLHQGASRRLARPFAAGDPNCSRHWRTFCHYWTQFFTVPSLSRREGRCHISRRFDNIDGECYLPCICNLADHCLQDAVCFSRLSYGRCSHTNPCCGLWVPDGVYPLCHACFYSCYSAAS